MADHGPGRRDSNPLTLCTKLYKQRNIKHLTGTLALLKFRKIAMRNSRGNRALTGDQSFAGPVMSASRVKSSGPHMLRTPGGEHFHSLQWLSCAVFTAAAALFVLAPGFDLGCGSVYIRPPNPPQQAVNLLYDDDCDADIDCAITQPILNHWIDLGYAKVWGMVSSGHSRLGAPTLRVFRDYYGHTSMFPVGAWTPGCEANPSAPWNLAVVNRFDPGDTCAAYANCVAVLRQSVERYVASGGSEHGLRYVITGPLSCEEAFRISPPDTISTMSGIQMEQLYISQFVLMNGVVLSGGETNCEADAPACASFFANVTAGNGYPPVYVVSRNTGAADVITHVPVSTLPQSNPTACAFASQGTTSGMDEDSMAVEYAIYGGTGWTASTDSTNTAQATTGVNTWNVKKPSGHYYLGVPDDQEMFEGLLSNPWLPPS